MGRADPGASAHIRGSGWSRDPRLETAVSRGWCSRGPRGEAEGPGAGEVAAVSMLGGGLQHTEGGIGPGSHLCSPGEEARGDTVG